MHLPLRFYFLGLTLIPGLFLHSQQPTLYRDVLGTALAHPTLQRELLMSGQHPEKLSCMYTNFLIPSSGSLPFQTTTIPLLYGRPDGPLALNQAMLLKLSLNPHKARVKLAIGPELVVNLRLRYHAPNWQAERVFIKKRRQRMTSFRWYW